MDVPKSLQPDPLAVVAGHGPGVDFAANATRYERVQGDPIFRPLKIYTIDPSSSRLEGQTAEIKIPFEALRPGPIGERFEVVATPNGPFSHYDPVDLDEGRLLIANGLDPAPTNPNFHHQMVYAVAMSTYEVFRTALGRELSWSFPDRRLKLIPHAFEGANARYVRDRQALEFGWYRVPAKHAGQLPPEGKVFACLSHDIIVHELTHALLDGLRARFDETTNPDVPAFHEAFADLVALLQRFSYSQVVRANIIRTGGDLSKDNDLLHFGFQLARGSGAEAVRSVDLKADQRYDSAEKEHDLGTVLVSAIVSAFLKIYRRRSERVIRIATGGSSPPDPGRLSTELIDQLTHIACKLANQFLRMCIRAIDYCPPIDIQLGEYLRALVTADRDFVPDDPYAYREALVEAFSERRIYPAGVEALTEDGLLWKPPRAKIFENGLEFSHLRFAGTPGKAASKREIQRRANSVLKLVSRPESLCEFGLAQAGESDLKGDEVGPITVESVRVSRRIGPDGQFAFDIVGEVSQKRTSPSKDGWPEFEFYGGSTVILDAQGEVRLVVSKSIKDNKRFDVQRKFAMDHGSDVYALRRCRHEPPPRKPDTDHAKA